MTFGALGVGLSASLETLCRGGRIAAVFSQVDLPAPLRT
jgi:hypothetical protein